MCVELKGGYLFRVLDARGYISDTPFVGSAVANRLQKHLKDLNLNNGETMHSFRSGCSITLSLLGVSYDQVAKHVGWKSVDMAVYYSQLDKVMAPDDASTIIAEAASKDTFSSAASHASNAERLGAEFRCRNFLQGFKPLFN